MMVITNSEKLIDQLRQQLITALISQFRVRLKCKFCRKLFKLHL